MIINEDYKIVLADYKYIPDTLEMLEEFSKESLSYYGIEVKPKVLVENINIYMPSTWFLLYKDKPIGIISFTITTPLGSDEKLANEIVWYVLKPHRKYGLKLLTYAEEQLILKGVRHIVVYHMGNLNNRLHKIYGRKGFEYMQSVFIKHIGDELCQ